KYPTALVDFDGNERSSIHLRDSDLNVLHLLLLELKKSETKGAVREAAADAVLSVIDRRRANWQQTTGEMNEELAALDRWLAATKPRLATLPIKNNSVTTTAQDRNKPSPTR